MEKPNLDYIIKLSRNDKAIKQKFIGVLQYELPLEIAAYYDSLQHSNWALTAECIHKLKNKIGILGLTTSYDLADHYEKNKGDHPQELKQAFEETLTLMQQFVDCL